MTKSGSSKEPGLCWSLCCQSVSFAFRISHNLIWKLNLSFLMDTFCSLFPAGFSFVADSSYRGVNVLSLFPEKHWALLLALIPACVLPHAGAGFESLFCPGVQHKVSWILMVRENLSHSQITATQSLQAEICWILQEFKLGCGLCLVWCEPQGLIYPD